MADKKDDKASKKATSAKKKTTMRESAAKTRAKAVKPKRVRKAASTATKPVKATKSALTQEYHLVDQKDGGNFFTKSRTLTPNYFKNAWKELKHVTWPNRRETWRLVFAVFVFALVLGGFIAVLDFGLEKLMREVIL